MKWKHPFLIVTTVVLLCGLAAAVQPAREGPLGNPEEPALRVLKWPWLGLRRLFVGIQDGLHSGIHKHPPAAIAKGAQGAATGAGILIHHTVQGLLHTPLPARQPLRQPQTYEQHVERALNALFPEAEACDAEREYVSVQEVPVMCAPTPEEAHVGPPLLVPHDRETEVQRAQRRYVPLQAGYRDRHKHGTGNLLRLAR